MSKKSEKLKNLEKKFEMAESLISELDVVFEEDGEGKFSSASRNESAVTVAAPVVPEQVSGELLPAVPDKVEEEIFSLDNLKADFMLVRQNILRVINAGQGILSQVGVLDLADMKASQLEALNGLQKTLAENLKLLVSIYKDIVDIEKAKGALKGSKGMQEPAPGTTVVQGNVNQNVLIAGGTHDMLDLLDQMRKKRDGDNQGQPEP